MVDPISSISSSPTQPLSIHFHATVDRIPTDKNEVANDSPSFYYTSTIISLRPSESASTDTVSNRESDQKKSNKSLTSTVQDCWQWVLGFFGANTPSSPPESVEGISKANQGPQLVSVPKLKEPSEIDQKKLNHMIAELNEHIHRIKETNEFEEEMRKRGENTKSYQMDKIIINQYFSTAMRQRLNKEEMGIEQQLTIFRRHQENKQLQDRFFSLWDEIKSRSQTTSLLSWINLGSTIGIVGAFAASFAVTGPTSIILFGLPALSLVKGVVSGAEGILKYKNNIKTGELFTIQEELGEHSYQIKNGIENMRLCDEEISQILKTLREQLKNQSDAERIFRNGAAAT